jgi:RHH-type transcriptional regulator, rel operon repressor / antitoxin RelB
MTTKTNKISKKNVITLRVSAEVKAGLDFLSMTSRRSKAFLAEDALSNYVEENAWQAKIIQERKEEAKKGIFVSEEKFFDWLSQVSKTKKRVKIPEPDVFLYR